MDADVRQDTTQDTPKPTRAEKEAAARAQYEAVEQPAWEQYEADLARIAAEYGEEA